MRSFAAIVIGLLALVASPVAAYGNGPNKPAGIHHTVSFPQRPPLAPKYYDSKFMMEVAWMTYVTQNDVGTKEQQTLKAVPRYVNMLLQS